MMHKLHWHLWRITGQPPVFAEHIGSFCKKARASECLRLYPSVRSLFGDGFDNLSIIVMDRNGVGGTTGELVPDRYLT